MIKPLKNNILIDIHRIDGEKSVIQFVDGEEAKVEKGTVLDCGDEVTLVKAGDVVYFKKYNLDTIRDGEEEFNLIPEDDLKGLVV